MGRRALAVLVSIGALACGDGVGQPILAAEAGGSDAAGSPGLAGSAGQASAGASGSTAGPGAGGSATDGSGGSTAQAGAGSGSGAANVAGGAAGNGDGPPPGSGGFGMGAGPPWEEPPDREGDWRDEDPLDAVPAGTHCESVVEWDEAAAEAEREVFRFLNFARESGFACRGEPDGPLSPLTMSPELRCAARLHARDMNARNFFDHVNPDGIGPEDRMRQAGATFAVASESIARDLEMTDLEVPYQALSELFAEDESACNDLMDERFEAVGIGAFEGYWTLDFSGR